MRFSVKRFCGGLVAAGLVGAAALYVTAEAGYDVPFFSNAFASEAVDPAAILTDQDGRRVLLDLAPDVAGAEITDTGGRFVVPALGVDLPLLEMSITRGVLNPPTLTDAFLVRETTPRIVALHSVQGGRAAGNALATVGADGRAKSAVQIGDQISLAGESFTVTQIVEQKKEDAALDAAIWHTSDGADRLVVITCLQHPGGPRRAPTNLIIHAHRR